MAEYAGKTVIFSKEDDLNAAIQQFEEETLTHFVVAGMTSSFSHSELIINTIRWHLTGYKESLEIPYDKIPFCWVGRKYLVCQFGKKKTYAKEKDSEEVGKPRHKRFKTTKKFNCPAKVTIKKIVKFPDFMVDCDKGIKHNKIKAKDRLLAALKKDSDSVRKEVQFYVRFSAIEEHKNHDMGEDAAKVEPIDPRVKAKIEELAQTGVSSCSVLHSLVHKYVEKELFKDQPLPPKARRRYFPKLKDVQNFMTRWKKKPGNEQPSVPSVWEEAEQEEEEMLNVEDDGGNREEQNENDRGEEIETEQSDVLEQVIVHTEEVDSDNIQEESNISQDQVPACTFIIHQGPISSSSTQEWVISNTQELSSTTQGLSNNTQGLNSNTQGLNSNTQGLNINSHAHILNSTNLQLSSSTQQLSNSIQQLSSAQQLSSTQEIGNSEIQDQSVVSGPYVAVSCSEQVSNVGQLSDQPANEEQSKLLSLLLNSSIQQVAVSTSSIPVDTVVNQQAIPKRKVQRIGLVRQMKDVMHDILDYSLLVKDLGVLQGFQANLEKMRDEASKKACLDPEVVQRELARNRRKRPAELHDLNTTTKHRATHLSDVL